MVTVTDIQKDLPDWPKEVIDPWLIEFANDPGMGWPLPRPYGDHRWGRLLGQREISWWQNVTQLMPQQKFADLGPTKPALEQDVWMGTHKDGELPNAQ